MKTPFVLFTFISIFLLSCTKKHITTNTRETYPFQVKGLLIKQGITTYQYGTHTLLKEGQTYALKSSTVNLNNYLDKTVTVKGEKIKGYPVDGGPEFIDVKEVE